MAMTLTGKLALEISSAAYEEIKLRLKLTHQDERIKDNWVDEGNAGPAHHEELDCGDIVLRREDDANIKVWILYEGVSVGSNGARQVSTPVSRKQNPKGKG